MKLIMRTLALLAGFLFINNISSAAVITVHDRDLFAFDATNQYNVVATFTPADSTFSWGLMDFCLSGELPSADTCGSLSVTITAPLGVNLYTAVTSAFDFGGHYQQIVSKFGESGLIPGGESYTYVLGGPYWPAEAHILTIQLADAAILDGGEMSIDALLDGPSFGTDTGTGGGGGGGQPPTVPEPGSLALVACGLGLLGLKARRRRLT